MLALAFPLKESQWYRTYSLHLMFFIYLIGLPSVLIKLTQFDKMFYSIIYICLFWGFYVTKNLII